MTRHAPVWSRPMVRRSPTLLLVVLLLLAAFPAAPAGAESPPRVLPRLLADAAGQPETTFRVIVGRRGADEAADRFVAAKGHRKVKEVDRVGFVAEVAGKDIAELGKHAAVKWVTVDAPMAPMGGAQTVDGSKLATVFNQTLGTPALWTAGITGKGVGVAVVDTGIESNLGDFDDGKHSQVVKRVVYNALAPKNKDGYGHGTQVAGVVAGNSWTSAEKGAHGKYIGVAPEADLVDVRVSDDQGQSYLSDVINGIEWVIANRAAYNIRVLNLSLLSMVPESATTSFLDAAVERAWFSGIFVVVAAGNLGPDTAMYAPANDPFVVTVGAGDPVGTPARGDDAMAPWSSYGTTQDGYAKPDLVAPGRYVVSTEPGNATVLKTKFSSRVVDKAYLWMSGTSLAAPQVAGVAALAFQKNPGLTNDALKWLLLTTASPLGATDPATGAFAPLPGQGAGLVDAAAVVNYLGPPGVANGGLPISTQLTGPDGATSYATSSWSSTSWSSTSWSTTSWSSSSWSSSSWSSATPQTAPWSYADVE